MQRQMLARFGATWPTTRCELCKGAPASGLFICEFPFGARVKRLCATCGLYNAAHKWTGHFGPKLLRIVLLCSITPEG